MNETLQLPLFDDGIGDWTFDDLREWAESFGLAWRDDEFAGYSALTCSDRQKNPKCEITVYIGRVWKEYADEYVPAVHFGWTDRRGGGYSGGGAAYDDIGKCAERIRAKASDFGFVKEGAVK